MLSSSLYEVSIILILNPDNGIIKKKNKKKKSYRPILLMY